MTSKNVLVIVDMQAEFKASRSCLDEVVAEAKYAIRYNQPIILLEYTPTIYGYTHRELVDVIGKYNKLYKATKNRDGGGHQIVEILAKQKLLRSKIKICGVNTCYCVASTAYQLEELKEIRETVVLLHACYCSHKLRQEMCFHERKRKHGLGGYSFDPIMINKPKVKKNERVFLLNSLNKV